MNEEKAFRNGIRKMQKETVTGLAVRASVPSLSSPFTHSPHTHTPPTFTNLRHLSSEQLSPALDCDLVRREISSSAFE